ncbi:MAG: hypothetical protein DRQ88_09225 [Epsilonproteobacteria bacterium]|nr:MAG: hypothetical protein DRQ88_09225 [Campylobacterota bacterium]
MKLTNTKDVASSRVSALIVGPSGVGKTSLVKTLDPDKTLILSAESGLLCLQGTNIDVFEINTMKDLDKVEEILANPKTKERYKNVFIDSLTEIGEMIVKELKNDPSVNDPKQAFRLWGEYAMHISNYIKTFRDFSPYNVFFTCLDSQKTDGLEKITTFNLPGQKIKDDIKSYFDIVFQYKIYGDDEGKPHRKLVTDIVEAPLAKDRSGKLDKYEEPHLGKILSKLLGGK